MPNRKYKTKESKKKSVLITTLFFLLSLPFVLYGVVQKTLDTRSKAFEELELSYENPCIISLPNVNPYTLEIGKNVRVQVDAKTEGDGITGLKITDSTGKEIYSETFEDTSSQIATSFVLTPNKSGIVDLLGNIETVSNTGFGCKISSPYNIRGVRAIQNNTAPEFTSEPSASSKPSQNITTGTQYSYTLTAKDVDGDRINFFYSFTPKATWLKDIVLEDGANGKLKVTFKGTPDKPASYLANVVIHDGYSKHVKSQSWVISVGQSENDTPVVKITNPLSSLRIDSGGEFKASWNVSDLNHIPTFDLFMSKNPTDESTWIKMGKTLPYNTSTRNIATKGLDEGSYKLIVRAIDNQKPPKTGIGVSPEIVISKSSGTTPKDSTDIVDDSVILQEPQVTNMSPSSTDEITNRRVTIKGTIVGSEKGIIKEESITFKIDDKDVTDKMKINKLSKKEYTLIYQPDEDLEDGLHRAEITFKDSAGKEVKKSWEFTIGSHVEEENDSYIIFGKEISKRTLLIIGIGLFIVIIAIAVPILISLIWGKGSKLETQSTTYSTRNIPERDYFEKEKYVPPTVNEDIHKKVNSLKQNDTVLEKKEKYTAPRDIVIEKRNEEPDIDIKEPQTKIKVEEPDSTPILATTSKLTPEKEERKKEPIFKPKVHMQKPITKSEDETPKPTQIATPPVSTTIEDEKEEPVFKPTVHIQKPITKSEDETPKPTPAVTPQVATPIEIEKEEEPVFKPTVHIQKPITTQPEETTQVPTSTSAPVTTPTPTPVNEKVEDTPVFTPTAHIQEPTTKSEDISTTPTKTEDIQEPEAPDPSIFQSIAAQIEEQQKQEETTPPTPNTSA